MRGALRLIAIVLLTAALSATAVYISLKESARSERTTVSGPVVERTVPANRKQVRLSFAPAVRKAKPAVVNIYVRQRRSARRSRLPNDSFFERFFGRELDIPRRRAQQSLGSGVIVSAEGLVVTNYHVIQGRRGGHSDDVDIKVALSDGREYAAEVVLKDKKTDLTVLRLQTEGDENFAHITFADSDQAQVGDLVLAIGNPFGVGQTVTSGIVSAAARTRIGITDYQFFIQTDAAINPGNSGGALVDMEGRLLGINTAIFTRSGGSHGIGFAIPANMVRVVVESALQGGRVQRPWLGMDVQSVDSDLARGLGLERPRGAVIVRVKPEGPADEAGLREGDVILAVDGRKVSDADALRYRLVTKGVDSEAAFKVWRSGDEITARIRLRRPPEAPPRNTTKLDGSHPFSGATVENLSPAVAAELRIEETSGVVIRETDSYSTARQIGLRPGDIILEINQERISRVRDLNRILQQSAGDWELTIKRGGELLRTVVRG